MDEEEDSRAPTVGEFFEYLVYDDGAVAARSQYCIDVSKHISSVAMWLGLDASLGGGDLTIRPGESASPLSPDPVRMRAFVAVGLVAQFASELIIGTLQLLENGRLYSASALMRQLIECEYLLRTFQTNFVDGSRWLIANDEERWDFAPSKLRKIIGFDRKEYADHCDVGGHPNPKGGSLLELQSRIQKLNRVAVNDDPGPDLVKLLWLDFAFHCDRIWKALDTLLNQEHARYETVRADAKSAALQSFAEWDSADPLAKHFDGLQSALTNDPSLPIDQLFL